MSDKQQHQVPEGFVAVPSGLGFTDLMQPASPRQNGAPRSSGTLPHQQHGPSRGIAPGGVSMTLADQGAASPINPVRGILSGAPTVNLSLDFITSAHIGEWLQTEAEHISVKRRFGFSSGVIRSSRGVVARFNGTFYFPDHEGLKRGDGQGMGVLGAMKIQREHESRD